MRRGRSLDGRNFFCARPHWTIESRISTQDARQASGNRVFTSARVDGARCRGPLYREQGAACPESIILAGALSQIRCYRTSVAQGLLADPATKLKITRQHRWGYPPQRIGGPDLGIYPSGPSGVFRLIDTRCDSHRYRYVMRASSSAWTLCLAWQSSYAKSAI